MRICAKLCVMLSVAAAASMAAPARAIVPVSVGPSWDGPTYTLQNIVDANYGPGHIDVLNDYIGAHPGDLDPWFWVDNQFSALLIREIAGNANRNTLGWYLENGSLPVIDDIDDGVVFAGPASDGATAIIHFDHPMTKFGFYLNPNGHLDATNAPEPEKFYTNRLYNDRGPDGTGAIHAPFNGDVQALVFDVSRWTQPNTWLVCFEDLDSGPFPAPCCETDNDFNDLVFEVTAFGATPTTKLTFGAIKARYR
jgi:hypothetical protein